MHFRAFHKKSRKGTKKPSLLLARALSNLIKKSRLLSKVV
jgi:hypothetical protein